MDVLKLMAFPSELGWMGILLRDKQIEQFRFGFSSQLQCLQCWNEHFDLLPPNQVEKRWIKKLQSYAMGKRVNLSKIPINLDSYTSFQATVLTTCRGIPYGQTMTYGQLAAEAGSPRAFRAAGSTMKKNRFPLLVPCHRVVASGGLGGYSSDEGVSLKKRLLVMEGVKQLGNSATASMK